MKSWNTKLEAPTHYQVWIAHDEEVHIEEPMEAALPP